MPTKKISATFDRRWLCQVVASGFHNGASCTPDDPHHGWGCGFRWTAAPLTDRQVGYKEA